MEDIRRMYKLRHGSEDPADVKKIASRICDISRKLHIPYSTVGYALKRYEDQGCRWVNLKSTNLRAAWIARTKIKGALKTYLLSHKTLTEWAGLSLRSRVKEIEANVGMYVSTKTLSKFYRANGVSHVVVKYQY